MNKEDWIPPTYEELRTENFKNNPFHCEDCGCHLNFRNIESHYAGEHKKRIMITGPYDHCLCKKCLALRVMKWFTIPAETINAEHYDTRKYGTCDICDKQREVASIIWDEWASIRIGSNWWNGYWACCECICEGLVMGSKPYGFSFGKHLLNEVGARIENL